MVSSFTSEGAQVTTDALMEGAFDFVLKPSSNDSLANRQMLRDSLDEKIAAFRESLAPRRRRSRRLKKGASEEVAEDTPEATSACQAVVIGCSTGGPAALRIVMSKLREDLPVPLFVVQHMPAQYTRSLASRLNDYSPLQVVEAEDGVRAAPGTVYLAPGGKQMQVKGNPDRLVIAINDDPPENGIRPSVDYMLRSAAKVLEGNALAVIMTGMGRDGIVGASLLKQAGGFVFAQHQEDCVVYGMPKAVVESDLADRILPLGKIAPAIMRHVKRSRRA